MTRLIRFTRMYIAMDDAKSAKRKRNKNAIEENRNKNFFWQHKKILSCLIEKSENGERENFFGGNE